MNSKNIDDKQKDDGQLVGLLKDIDRNKYPKYEIQFLYLLLSGAISGLLYFFYFAVRYHEILGDVIVAGFILFNFIKIGASVGAIPGLATGVIISLCEIKIKNNFSYVLVGIVGYAVSFTILHLYVVLSANMSENLLFSSFGGLSAIVLAFFFVPKEKLIK